MQFGNSKAPIYIKSTSMSLDYQNHSVLWTGNVHATQADSQLTSDQLRVNYFDKDFKQMKDMIADGNVRLSQGTRWATGKHGVMDQTKRTVILTGSPVAHDGNDQITGCKITVYLNTSQSVVDCAHAVLFPHSDASPAASASPGATRRSSRQLFDGAGSKTRTGSAASPATGDDAAVAAGDQNPAALAPRTRSDRAVGTRAESNARAARSESRRSRVRIRDVGSRGRRPGRRRAAAARRPTALTAPTPTTTGKPARARKSPRSTVEVEARDAALEIKELNNLEKLDWREYLETYSNNWQESTPADNDDDHRSALENTPLRRSSLEDYMMWQLRMSSLPESDQPIGATIIYNLNEDGYLETPVEELAAQLEIAPAEVERVLARVQRFDPPGVAARDLRECLLAQLQNLGMEESLAARIVSNHLDLLEKHRYAEIAKVLGVPVETVGQAAKIISLLEPKPGRDYGGDEPTYVVPDVYIHKVGEDYVVTLNRDAVPRLRLAGYYQRVLNDVDVAPETREYLAERLRSARWLVKSIYQRQQTIFKVATSIVKFQRAFFDHGISLLKPLVLKDVAEDIGMHESTISRATANKYAHTPQGIFELKFFFTSGVKGAGGEDVSAETVKEQIRGMVTSETPQNPLSDQAIAEMLRAEADQYRAAHGGQISAGDGNPAVGESQTDRVRVSGTRQQKK